MKHLISTPMASLFLFALAAACGASIEPEALESTQAESAALGSAPTSSNQKLEAASAPEEGCTYEVCMAYCVPTNGFDSCHGTCNEDCEASTTVAELDTKVIDDGSGAARVYAGKTYDVVLGSPPPCDYGACVTYCEPAHGTLRCERICRDSCRSDMTVPVWPTRARECDPHCVCVTPGSGCPCCGYTDLPDDFSGGDPDEEPALCCGSCSGDSCSNCAVLHPFAICHGEILACAGGEILTDDGAGSCAD